MDYLEDRLGKDIFSIFYPYYFGCKVLDVIKKLKKRKQYLTTFGFTNKERFDKDRFEFDLENISDCIKQIPVLLKPRKSINNKISSYGLKHTVERYRNSIKRIGYCSNGDLIVAMIMLGYQIKTIIGSPNCRFNCSEIKYKQLKKGYYQYYDRNNNIISFEAFRD